MAFFWLQLCLSVVLVTIYILLTFVMGHNECRYDSAFYADPEDDEVKPKKLEDQPNVTTTIQICFMAGLVLHVLIFFINIYFEPSWRYYTGKNNQKDNFMQQ